MTIGTILFWKRIAEWPRHLVMCLPTTKPEMSAEEVTSKVLAEIDSEQAALIIVNFANGDMVGHTGVVEAAVKAVEKVDSCVGQIVEATLARVDHSS